MKLVTGGAFQGKWNYARERYQVFDGWIDGKSCELEEIGTCRGIFHFHEYVRRMVEQKYRNEREAAAAGQKNCAGAENPGNGEGDVNQERKAARPWELSVDSQAQDFADALIQKNPGIIIVTNELGYGVVPIDPFDREYRETTGRICTCLAAKAEEVIRVVCGIGMILKKSE